MKSGKSTISNILGDLQDGLSSIYRPTQGLRIVEFEKDPPASAKQFGKVHVELWDVSGDFKYEKGWAPIQQDVQGIMFVYDPTNPDSENDLKTFVEKFPKALRIKPVLCQAFINPHNPEGSKAIPGCMKNLESFVGSAEDSQGVGTTFEKYLARLIKQLIQKQESEESQYAT
eukprot:CAMPEP_0170480372 /NCGR_PEP_ID=MMETSP0208-20121228/1238_1 /TAXON_ID=197538 /ORGANISM="Strombidium inclinatum, Strain S3" /LENGTH=171 /DNA_ID=CAMNT_0010752907 /DNA_START=48 /DNA_END=563 /DNA_ORIENTATION=+